jgi:predicted sulfurtransferase
MATDTAITEDHNAHRIALYYIYIPIVNVKEQIDLQLKLCGSKLKGRIRVASEGINGVLSGLLTDLEAYESDLCHYLGISKHKLDLKYCQLRRDLSVESQLFGDLRVQKTKHVVSLVNEDEQSKKNPEIQKIQQLWKDAQQTKIETPHLSPDEWNERLDQAHNVILLDCRNNYESNVGRFEHPNATTLLTNTRKYSELPQVLLKQAELLQQADSIMMYCTGGVRCERASAFLRTMLHRQGKAAPPIYQLQGGIQRYLEQPENRYYFRGKNFCFDPRRYDPSFSTSSIVGTCIVCHEPHDDYDNGAAPSEDKEARCCHCRILILVCNKCRETVAVWGCEHTNLPPVYCGGDHCIPHTPVTLLQTPTRLPSESHRMSVPASSEL